jgi:hypothetical protein
VPADYDGDGTTDPAVCQRGTGTRASSVQYQHRRTAPSAPTDVPVPGDDNDGRDPAVGALARAVAHPAVNTNAVRTTAFGTVSTDVPVPADYDGDGKVNLAVYRPSTGQYLIRLATGQTARSSLAGSGDPLQSPYSTDAPAASGCCPRSRAAAMAAAAGGHAVGQRLRPRRRGRPGFQPAAGADAPAVDRRTPPTILPLATPVSGDLTATAGPTSPSTGPTASSSSRG